MFRKFLLGSTASACAAAAGVAAVAHFDEDEAVRQAEAILPRAYAPEPFEKFWGGQHRCVAARRVFEIAGTLIPFAGRAVWHYNVTNRNGDAWDELRRDALTALEHPAVVALLAWAQGEG